MPIASAVVVPFSKEVETLVLKKLEGIGEVELKGVGDGGIAVVMEAAEVGRLKDLSKEIEGWEEVIEFNLTYLNWEEME